MMLNGGTQMPRRCDHGCANAFVNVEVGCDRREQKHGTRWLAGEANQSISGGFHRWQISLNADGANDHSLVAIGQQARQSVGRRVLLDWNVHRSELDTATMRQT